MTADSNRDPDSLKLVAVKYASFLLLLITLLYMGMFALDFQLTGLPVRNNEFGWLGPPYRVDPEVQDIGKIYYYEGDDYKRYKFFRPLCKLWLALHGF